MNITQEKIDTLNAVVKIELAPEDYLQKVEDAIKTLRKKVELKGFRKGQTPAGIIKKMYGNSVLVEELNKILNDNLTEYLKSNNIEILGNPLPKENGELQIDINEPKNYSFAYELGLTPEFEIGYLSKSTTVPFYKIKLDDAFLNKEIESVRKRYGKMTNPEDATREDDVLFGTLEELNEDGTVKEVGISNQVPIALDMVTDKAAKDALLALKIGDSAVINLFEAFGNKSREEIEKHFLNLKEEDAKPANDKFQFTLNKINRVELAEMNEEFFSMILGPGKATTEAEFRELFSQDIQKYFDQQSKNKMQNHILDALLEHTEITLPDDFLKRWIEQTNEKPISAQEVEEQYPDFAKNLKSRLVFGKLIKQHNIEVSQEELRQHTLKGLQTYLNLTDEMMQSEDYQSWVKNMLGNKEHVERTYDEILQQKLIAAIERQISFEEKEVSMDEFKELK